ncbi:hypothetical protein EAH88_10960 [Rhodanobacter glycinis]|uniref:Lysine-specific metallo-endopeptidase domain-containing protein n=1 Tax=Rhodanobacter glycinis TaxID=582702 RepID=A0A502C870_9GAMM|nr:hypothetical protein EAH88_10960 [Rhodanobacter glycinis]
MQGGQLTQAQWAHVNYYFKLDPQNTNIPAGVIGKLQATLDGIKANQLKVRVMFFNFAKPTDKKLITIAKAQILNVNQAVRFFIHECTHIYADTDDHSERGYGNNQGTYRQPGLTPEEAPNNADTYAYLTVQLAGRALL